jgi:threonine dehydrogenase-like Zn-dependent dehydrogenase
MTYAIIPNEVMEINCLIKYEGEAYFEASLAEPMSCVIGGFHASYHVKPSTYHHIMDIQKGGALAILGGCGPMGLGAIDYAIHREHKPSVIIVTDISNDRLKRAAKILTVKEAAKHGVALHYVNPNELDNPIEEMKALNNGKGYDDVFVYVPIKDLVIQGDQLLGKDGCMNFFAGPIDNQFSSPINMYNIHYAATKIIGSTGGNTDDMIESLEMTAKGLINPAVMLTHVGGLDSAAETILHLPKIPGGKKIIYTQIDMPLTAIEDFREKAKDDKRYEKLADICEKHDNLWNLEAETYLIETFKVVD